MPESHPQAGRRRPEPTRATSRQDEARAPQRAPTCPGALAAPSPRRLPAGIVAAVAGLGLTLAGAQGWAASAPAETVRAAPPSTRPQGAQAGAAPAKERASAEKKPAKADKAPVSAEESFDKGMELFADRHYKDAIAFFKDAVEARPDHAKAHMYLGTCYAKTGADEKGVFEYEEFVHLAPAHEMAPKVVQILKKYYETHPQRPPRYPLP